MAATPRGKAVVKAEPITREVLLAQYGDILQEIPMAEDGDGFGIIVDILNATSWEDLNRDAEMDDMRDWVGKRIKVTNMIRRESTLDNGMPWYLIVDAVDVKSGELVKINTSSGSIMAKLAMLHHWGNIPAVMTVTKAEKATKAGFHPLDVTIEAVEPTKAR